MISVELDLSERYNEGLVPEPDLAVDPARMPRPAWQPTAIQVQAARKQLFWSASLLLLLIFACLFLSWWLSPASLPPTSYPLLPTSYSLSTVYHLPSTRFQQ
jgi:hypothetical protein